MIAIWRNVTGALGVFCRRSEGLEHTDTVRRMVGGECLFVPLKPVTKWMRAASALVTGQPITTAYFGSPAIAQWVKSLVQTPLDRPRDRLQHRDGALHSEAVRFRSGASCLRHAGHRFRQMAPVFGSALHCRTLDLTAVKPKKLLRLERAAAAKFGVTTLVSGYEAASFAEMAPESAKRIRALGQRRRPAKSARALLPIRFRQTKSRS